MSIEVEVSLRIPKTKSPSLDRNGHPIDHTYVRFAKLIQVPVIPKSGEPLQVTTSSGHTLACEVGRVAWSEERSLFILECKYAKRSIPADECAALLNDSQWTMRQLL